ncbi:pantetheine-phosphate adenylyltransferase [Weissella ceti]|uniref:Phosphopantetheine adenylyltransferase n=1 Tax=Weissella ceti TaxID=759620 RepID=A0ABT3E384_9LACO|nr:pantetheine-phosphate adenylyltransferase [Weissella ceti]MCW0952875.1 pantetheine-phosphate adenylyltransferase [Weissella ceti]QVK12570.1 pantetheine-phosphate adenylyltransferase [Weissella ceti]
MKRALFPGSFDPFTNGHLDIVTRASHMFDEVVIGIGINSAKTAMFTDSEKVDLIASATNHLTNVRIELMQGLTAEFAKKIDAEFLVRGIRNEQDFLYERNISEMNHLLTEIETVFFMARPENQMLASSVIKEVAKAGGSVDKFLPAHIATALKEKMS